MSPKNLNVQKKTHKFLFKILRERVTLKIYNKFEKELNLDKDFIVAVSGGPDSLALSFLTKIYAIKKNLNVKYFLVDHKLRQNSTKEAKFVKLLFKKIFTNLEVLTWVGKKPRSNIQSLARNKRYELLIREAKKLKIHNILLGHHEDDMIENFFIRILRGSGLNGIISLSEKSKHNNINLIRPLLKFSKKNLEQISKKVFGIYVDDPSNKNKEFKRVKIRNLLKNLEEEGLNKNKFNLTIKNLKFANDAIKYFIEKNIKDNSTTIKLDKIIILNKNFFYQPEEVVFRSLTKLIQIVGKKYYPARGKKIFKLIDQIKFNKSLKTTLGNCIFKKVNDTVLLTKEH